MEIQKALADPGGVLPQPGAAGTAQRKLRLVLPWMAVTAILIIIIGAVGVWKFKQAEPPQAMDLVFQYSLIRSGAGIWVQKGSSAGQAPHPHI